MKQSGSTGDFILHGESFDGTSSWTHQEKIQILHRGHCTGLTSVTGSLAGHLDLMIKCPSVRISTWWLSVTVTDHETTVRDGQEWQGGSKVR